MTIEERIQLIIDAANEVAQLANHRAEELRDEQGSMNRRSVSLLQAIKLEQVAEELTDLLDLAKHNLG